MKSKTSNDSPGAVPKPKRKHKARNKSAVKVERSVSPTGSASDLEEKPSERPFSSTKIGVVKYPLETLEMRTRRKEKMVEIGVSFLSRLQTLMGDDGRFHSECKLYIEQCRSMISMGNKPRTLIGFLGTTGAGKSSLLNALVREDALLPTNSMRASTAVVIEVSFNQSNDAKQAYGAEIQFCSSAEWVAEFEVLRRDIEDLLEENSSADDSDSELNTAIAKLKAVYPGRSLQKLLALTPQDIKSSMAKELLKSINKYVDSSNGSSGSGSIEYWPLVKLVKIFTEAEILKDGLVLVDLPGVGDSNAARGKVAKAYLKNLSHIWIVADINRAVSDKVAESPIDSSLKEHLYMNESYDDKFVAFITTKTDIINTEEAIDTLNLEHTGLNVDIEREASLGKELNKLLQPLGLKRKLTDMEETGDNKENEHKIAALHQQLDILSASIRGQCIQARNQFTKDRLGVQFRDGAIDLMKEFTASDKPRSKCRVMDQATVDTLTGNLNVFCVSSKGFQKLHGMLWREKPMPEFRAFEDTGIPSLEAFSVLCTLDVREAASDKFLAEMASLTSSIRFWAEEGQSQYRLSEIERDCLIGSLEKQSADLKEAERKANYNMRRNFKNILDKRLVSACTEAVQEGTKDIVAAVIAFSKNSGKSKQEMAWGTMRAIIRRRGKYEKASPRLAYDLNERLTRSFLKPILGPWRYLFRDTLSCHHSLYTSLIIKALDKFEESFKHVIKEICGHFPPLQRLMARLSADRDRVCASVDYCLRRKQTRANEARENIPGYIQRSMDPFYEECMQIKGRGSLIRMKALLRDIVKAHAREMFTQASLSTIGELKELNKLLKQEPSNEIKKILDSIIDDVRHVIESSATPLHTEDIEKESKDSRNRILGEILEMEDNFTRLTPASGTDGKSSFNAGLDKFKHITLDEEYIDYDAEIDEEKAPS
ncbi:uncharacterized protein RSE6_04373 [Rhynchosporium secalis]|uniref:Nuclear GTPase SLIP-GC n=1 Tax=Rhynchosporium secalis TaxID=38038 RepID=A0A1E1M6J3_RHYSE|nr:uncharacterized protein RSE6_04373 [Rhynchosporium secalis]